MEFIAGVESELSARSIALTIQLVDSVEEEIAVYRRWWGEHRVDGVLVVDLRVDDPRVDELVRLGLPAVVIGGPVGIALYQRSGTTRRRRSSRRCATSRRSVTADRARLRRRRVRPHACSGSRRSTRATRELGLDGEVVETDYTPESGARATRRLLSSPEPPTRDHLRQRPARRDRSRRRPADGIRRPRRPLDRSAGTTR